ncbi:retron-type RNA-directed DNA polymerase [Lachnospiraceae bacterium KM106-2]|nr:retron-type RNA-directed DNA polymerase [Lachnospiraceae bacterium KM106-2]
MCKIMILVLKKKIKIDRPIIFLCGPFYKASDKNDRRNILKDFLLTESDKKCIPLIIDDFVTEENIKDTTISIQLLEEIFAAIALKTYVFLDTMSAATELGLFTNNAFINKVQAYIPVENDIIYKNIGYFVKDVVLDNKSGRVAYMEYHPRIKRVPIATDYVVEHYEFINNILPLNIQEGVRKDLHSSLWNEKEVEINESAELPSDHYKINYKYDVEDNILRVNLSVQYLFYIVGGLIYSEYSDELVKNETIDFDDSCIEILEEKIKLMLRMFIQMNIFCGINQRTYVQVNTVIKDKMSNIIRHMVKFIFLYHQKSRLNGYFLVNKKSILKEVIVGKSPIDFFHFTENDISYIKDINSNKGKYYECLNLKLKGKKRELVTYSENDREGKANYAKYIHKKVVSIILENYQYSNSSYAYRKGYSIKDCVAMHKNSTFFLKFDISKFFNSIDLDILVMTIMEEFSIGKSFKMHVEEIVSTCFIDNEMQLGLILSPILSDIYMKKFDQVLERMGKECGFIYTRYADDILISSSNIIADQDIQIIKNAIQSELKLLKLKENSKKYKKIYLKSIGQHIKFLGLNIVRMMDENKITVGKEYKNYIAKEYLQFIDMKVNDEEDKKCKFYWGKRIIGYLSFVKMIEGEKGENEVYIRILKSTGGRIAFERERLQGE